MAAIFLLIVVYVQVMENKLSLLNIAALFSIMQVSDKPADIGLQSFTVPISYIHSDQPCISAIFNNASVIDGACYTPYGIVICIFCRIYQRPRKFARNHGNCARSDNAAGYIASFDR